MAETENPRSRSAERSTLLAFSLIGILLCLLLVEAHTASIYGAHLPAAICGPSATCSKLLKSPEASFLELPWAWWGLAWFAAWLSLALAIPTPLLSSDRKALLGLSALGLLIDLCLALAMIRLEHGICRLCVATWLVNLLIFAALALLRSGASAASNLDRPKRIRPRDWLRSFSLFVAVLIFGALARHSEKLSERRLARSLLPNLSSLELKPYPKEIERGDPSALQELVLVLDPQCEHCHELWSNLLALQSERPEQLHLTAVLFPLDRGCNSRQKTYDRSGSCEVARALLASPDSARQDQILRLAGAGQAAGPESLRKALAPLGLQPKDYQDSAPSNALLLRHLSWAREHGVDQVPTLFISGRRLLGSIPKESLRCLLQEILRLDREAPR